MGMETETEAVNPHATGYPETASRPSELRGKSRNKFSLTVLKEDWPVDASTPDL